MIGIIFLMALQSVSSLSACETAYVYINNQFQVNQPLHCEDGDQVTWQLTSQFPLNITNIECHYNNIVVDAQCYDQDPGLACECNYEVDSTSPDGELLIEIDAGDCSDFSFTKPLSTSTLVCEDNENTCMGPNQCVSDGFTSTCELGPSTSCPIGHICDPQLGCQIDCQSPLVEHILRILERIF